MSEPFIVFKRKDTESADNKIFRWYVRYQNPENGEIICRLSLSKLNAQLFGASAKDIKSKAQAYKIAQTALDRGLIKNLESADILFSEYALKVWDFEKSDYIRRRNKAKANSICRNYADLQMTCLKCNVIPNLPKNLKLRDFKRSHAERVKDRMLDKGLASGTINKAMQVIRTALKEAYRTGLINENIADRVENIEETPKLRGIPTREEVSKLIENLDDSTCRGHWERGRYLAITLAVCTGMRLGEIRALKAEDIVIHESYGEINVTHSYSDADGLKCTKGKYSRKTTAPAELCTELVEYSGLNPDPDGFLFFSAVKPSVPICPNLFRDWLHQSFEEIGISKEELQERNITFHSLRHFYASLMRDTGISTELIKETIGHKSDAMIQHYTHETEEHLRSVEESRARALPLRFSK